MKCGASAQAFHVPSSQATAFTNLFPTHAGSILQDLASPTSLETVHGTTDIGLLFLGNSAQVYEARQSNNRRPVADNPEILLVVNLQ